MKNRKLFLSFLFIFTTLQSFSQIKIDSIFKVLKTAKHDTTRVIAYADLCRNYENLDSAIIFGNNALKLAKRIYFRKGIAKSYSNLGVAFYYKNDKTNALHNYLKALEANKIIDDKYGMASNYSNIGIIKSTEGKYDEALSFYSKALNIHEKLKNHKEIAMCYNNIGIVYDEQGIYEKALEFYFKALKIDEKLGIKSKISSCCANIGIVFKNQGSFNKAIEYYQKALKIDMELKNERGISYCYTNIGNVYSAQKKHDEAIKFYFQTLEIANKLNDKYLISASYTNIGNIYQNKKNYSKALEYYSEALKIKEELNDQYGIILLYINISNLNLAIVDSSVISKKEQIAHINKSIDYGLKALELSRKFEVIPWEHNAAKSLMLAYKKLGNANKSLFYAEIFIATNDSLFKAEKTDALANAEAQYQNEKNQLIIDKLAKEKELQASENKKQKIVIFSITLGLLLIIAFAIFIVNRLRITRKQKLLIETQKQQIELIHEELTDSIRYAEKIQKALLPNEIELQTKIKFDFFILFKPKDIVSGDFYFVEQRNDLLYIAVADCTGHGVPGGFMSMLGISFLNEIIAKEEKKTASQILDNLRINIIKSLQQKGISGEQKDGMDIALAILNIENLELQFSGANNPLFIVKSEMLKVKSEENFCLEEKKGDKMPVAIHERMDNFTNHRIQLEKGNIIYLKSDGFEDQFGGEKGKKFLSKNLKKLLLENSQKPTSQQKQVLDKTLVNWKNSYNEIYEQTDDITVFGMKI